MKFIIIRENGTSFMTNSLRRARSVINPIAIVALAIKNGRVIFLGSGNSINRIGKIHPKSAVIKYELLLLKKGEKKSITNFYWRT